MAGSIKGIIVEIGGDTSGLQKALSKVNSATASLSKELKGINSLLKLDPKNTELLAQKQQVLTKNIEDTESKLKLLQSTYQRATEAQANGAKISEENIRALQREIIVTQNKLTDLKNEASNWTKVGNSLKNWGENLDKIGEKVDSLGNKLTTRLTIPISTAFGIAIKEAIEFESAFTGVEKTVDGTTEQLNNLKKGIKDLAKKIPSTTTEISSVAEAAGQLGIETDNILEFSKAMIDLGNSTNLTSDEAASQLAKFANIMQMSQKNFDKLGSSIVDLGNNYATTEADIVSMAMRLAGAGKQVGLSEGQVLGLATALSSVGIEAEMGGSAISKAMVKMQSAVEVGGDKLNKVLKRTGRSLRDLQLMSDNDTKGFKELAGSLGMTKTELKNMVTAGSQLKDFAEISGMTTEQFKKQWKKDASGALSAFIKGLGNTKNKGESAITMLTEMGLTEVRLRDSLLRAANAGELFNNAIETGTEAWKENTALTNEANKRYSTAESQLKITQNQIKDITTSLGEKLLPTIKSILQNVDNWISKFDKLSDSEQENIIKIGLMVAAAGPLLKVGSSAISIVGDVTKGIGTFSQAISLAHNGIGSATGSAATLAKMLQALTSPAGLAATGITVAVGIIVAQMINAEKATREAFENMGNSATNYISGIEKANSHLDEFNRTLFVSAEEQKKLEEEMQEVQKGITQICKLASDERREYTQQEIKQLDEYFKKLRELNQRELEIEQEIAKAISQQAITTAQNFKGSLEEYKTQSQEWIKTAEDQKKKEISIINTQTTEEIALLNQRFGKKADLSNGEYKREYEKIINNKDERIKQVNDEIAKINQAYTNGYLDRVKQNDGFYRTITDYNKKIEDENNRHEKALEGIDNNALLTTSNKLAVKRDENRKYQENQKKIWDEMYKNMSEEQEKELGTWLAMVSQTELYGGKINDETNNIVKSILKSYESMPDGTRKAMKDAMSPMLDEMKNKEPSLFSKAKDIAEGVLSRLKKAFDIHSPSKKTRDIFQNVMLGAELGIDEERKKLNKEIDALTNQVQEKFNLLNPIGNIKQTVIDSTKTIFTTPQIVFNVQEMNEENLEQCFNYVNRKFGSAY